MKYTCREPEGTIVRHVEPLGHDITRVLAVYDKLCNMKPCYWSGGVSRLESFIANADHYWLIDNIGLICFDPTPKNFAHVHIAVWDKRLRGREELFMLMLAWLLEASAVPLCLAVVREELRVIRAFALRVGFRSVGFSQGHEVLSLNAANFIMQIQGRAYV